MINFIQNKQIPTVTNSEWYIFLINSNVYFNKLDSRFIIFFSKSKTINHFLSFAISFWIMIYAIKIFIIKKMWWSMTKFQWSAIYLYAFVMLNQINIKVPSFLAHCSYLYAVVFVILFMTGVFAFFNCHFWRGCRIIL